MFNYSLNTDINQKIKTFCSRCNNTTNHSIKIDYEETYNSDDYGSCTNFQIIKCDGCDHISFRKLFSNSEEFEYNIHGEIVYLEREEIYPERTTKHKPIDMDDLHLIPNKCREIYKETNFSLEHKFNLLGAVGLRILTEAICLDQIRKKGINASESDNLFKKIDLLAEEGILSQDSKDILHAIRTIGNESAHQIEPQPIELLTLAFNILEDLLKTLYIYPKEFKKIKSQQDFK